MHRLSLAVIVTITCLFALPTLAQSDNPLVRPPKPIKGAKNDLDVLYLPGRETGAWQDRWLKMNVAYHNDDKRRPCIMFVHGGGYGGGDKDTGFCGSAMQEAFDAGFVVANLNYILGRDIFPQVFHDYKAAVRFLRANAEKYRIDPDRIGTWGFSAGGWLTSSGNFTNAGDLFVYGHKTALSESWADDDPRGNQLRNRIVRPDKQGNVIFAQQMDAAEPRYGAYSARIMAHQGDFNQFEKNITPDAPAVHTYVGPGGVSKLDESAKAAGIDFYPMVITHPKKNWNNAHSVHVPPLNTEFDNPFGKGQTTIQSAVLAWFKTKLIDSPTTPAPEFRPNRRVFADQVTVHAVTTSPGVKVHYTTDGSTPTLKSPVWTKPIKLNETTVVKALAVRDGMKPSGVTTARFTKGAPPPNIVSPTQGVLKAKVGQPFKTSFRATGSQPIHWRLIAHFRTDKGHRYKGTFAEFSGLTFDTKAATLSGTPNHADVYTLQVLAAYGPGKLAQKKTYVLHVTE